MSVSIVVCINPFSSSLARSRPEWARLSRVYERRHCGGAPVSGDDFVNFCGTVVKIKGFGYLCAWNCVNNLETIWGRFNNCCQTFVKIKGVGDLCARNCVNNSETIWRRGCQFVKIMGFGYVCARNCVNKMSRNR